MDLSMVTGGTNWGYIEPVFLIITFVMIVFCLFATDNTLLAASWRQDAQPNSIRYGFMRRLLLGIILPPLYKCVTKIAAAGLRSTPFFGCFFAFLAMLVPAIIFGSLAAGAIPFLIFTNSFLAFFALFVTALICSGAFYTAPIKAAFNTRVFIEFIGRLHNSTGITLLRLDHLTLQQRTPQRVTECATKRAAEAFVKILTFKDSSVNYPFGSTNIIPQNGGIYA